jgi:hypothetical protein
MAEKVGVLAEAPSQSRKEKVGGLADPDATTGETEGADGLDHDSVYGNVKYLAPDAHRHPEAAEIDRLMKDGKTPQEIFEEKPELENWYRRTFMKQE